MADQQAVVGILNVMQQCAGRLPQDWEDDFWRGSLHTLAELVADSRHRLTEKDQGVLIGIGAMMVRQLSKEAEALSLTEQVFGRVRIGGAHDAS